jgi:hypothetical protein
MSAWIVGNAHIDLLVRGLVESEIVVGIDPNEVGRTLWRENLASVAARYPGDKDGERPGPISFRDSDVDTYIYVRPEGPLDLGVLLNAANSYDYQSCEHSGWAPSSANRWITELVASLERADVTSARKPNGAADGWDIGERPTVIDA